MLHIVYYIQINLNIGINKMETRFICTTQLFVEEFGNYNLAKKKYLSF